MQAAQEYSCAMVTTPNIAVARKLAMLAISARLAACANLIPKIESHYWWDGQLQSSSEVLVLFKALNASLAELERCVLKNHPYTTPEFLVLPLSQGNEKYLAWIAECSKK